MKQSLKVFNYLEHSLSLSVVTGRGMSNAKRASYEQKTQICVCGTITARLLVVDVYVFGSNRSYWDIAIQAESRIQHAQGTDVVVVSTVDESRSVPLWIASTATHRRRVPGEHLEENEQEAEEVADADAETDPPRPRQLADISPHVLVAEVLTVARAVHRHADDVEDGYEEEHDPSSLAFVNAIRLQCTY